MVRSRTGRSAQWVGIGAAVKVQKSFASLGMKALACVNSRDTGLGRGNQADGDGRSAGATDHGSYAAVGRVIAAAGDVEYMDLDIARVGTTVNLVYECL